MRSRLVVVAAVVLFAIGVVIPAGSAEAAPFARAANHGFFTNRCDNGGGSVITSGVHPTAAPLYNGKPFTASFISQVLGYLSGSGGNKTGAEFLILTMLGYPAGTPKATATFGFVQTNWVNLVHGYSDRGWIQWNVAYSFTSDTYYQGVYSSVGGICDGIAGFPDDDAWYSHSATANPAIVFHQPGTTSFYAIQESCANPLGDFNLPPLPIPTPVPNYNVTLSADTNGSPSTVVAGQSYRIGVAVSNSGPAASTVGDIEVMMPAAGVVQACGPTCNDPGQNVLLYGPTGPGGHSYRAASTIPGTVGRNWDWSVNPLGAGAGAGSVLNWTVAPGTPVGTVITFDVYYYKQNLAGGVQHVTVSFRVVSQRTPSISAANSDVHAGGGLCGQALSGGNVTTSPGGASYGQYVVSATGSINSLFSNNASSGVTDTLKLGNFGSYAQVCRADLWTAAKAGWPSGPGIHTIGGLGVASFVLAGNEGGVYYFNGTHLNLHGAVGNPIAPGVPPAPVTIVTLQPGAVVEIDGNITLNNTVYPPHSAPSLGIISAGDILIDPAVTHVDAYLFSSAGTIDTCNPIGSCSTPQLVVNGFLMAKNILFSRAGVVNTNGNAVSEAINLTPQIYLNPPKYFDASVDDVLLQGQGERAPLF